MGMDGILRAAVASVHAAFSGAAVDVVHEAWVGFKPGGYTEPDFAAPVLRKAFVVEGTDQVRQSGGDVITVRAHVAFRDPVPANGAPKRREPIDPRDRITLPSGLTGPIVDNPGATVDPTTGRPYVSAFWLR